MKFEKMLKNLASNQTVMIMAAVVVAFAARGSTVVCCFYGAGKPKVAPDPRTGFADRGQLR